MALQYKGKAKIESPIPQFSIKDTRLLYKRKICAQQKAVSSILQDAHDSKIGGQFRSARTMSRLSNFHTSQKMQNISRRIDGCIKSQK